MRYVHPKDHLDSANWYDDGANHSDIENIIVRREQYGFPHAIEFWAGITSLDTVQKKLEGEGSEHLWTLVYTNCFYYVLFEDHNDAVLAAMLLK